MGRDRENFSPIDRMRRYIPAGELASSEQCPAPQRASNSYFNSFISYYGRPNQHWGLCFHRPSLPEFRPPYQARHYTDPPLPPMRSGPLHPSGEALHRPTARESLPTRVHSLSRQAGRGNRGTEKDLPNSMAEPGIEPGSLDPQRQPPQL